MSVPPRLHVFTTADGRSETEAHITAHPQGFAVSIRDADSGEYLPTVRIYPAEAQAVAYARAVLNLPPVTEEI